MYAVSPTIIVSIPWLPVAIFSLLPNEPFLGTLDDLGINICES